MAVAPSHHLLPPEAQKTPRSQSDSSPPPLARVTPASMCCWSRLQEASDGGSCRLQPFPTFNRKVDGKPHLVRPNEGARKT